MSVRQRTDAAQRSAADAPLQAEQSQRQAAASQRQAADAVRAALVGMGVGTERVSTRGMGEAYPVASNDSAAGRQLNRRVEIVLSDDSGAIVPR